MRAPLPAVPGGSAPRCQRVPSPPSRLEQPRGLRRLVAERHQRAVGLGLRTRCRPLHRRPARGRGAPAPRAGRASRRSVARQSCGRRRECASAWRHPRSRTACAKAAPVTPERIASAMRGPTPETFNRLRNSVRSCSGGETIEHMRILAHHQMGQQARALAEGRQTIEGRHRCLDLVADAADLEQQVRRRFEASTPASEPIMRATARRRASAPRRRGLGVAQRGGQRIGRIGRERAFPAATACAPSARPAAWPAAP